jgi:hypothetical protein
VDTNRFAANPVQFAVLDLIADVEFVTATSIRFQLGNWEDGGGPAREPRGGVFRVVGSVDVHHPCVEHIKAQLVAILPAQYNDVGKMLGFVQTIFAELAIPFDETYEFDLVVPAEQMSFGQCVDRNGESDRFECES